MAIHTRRREEKRPAFTLGAWGRPVLGLVVLVVGALLLAGCPKKPEVMTGEPRAAAPPPAPAPEAKAPEPKPEIKPAAELKDVFFDFDKAELRPDARQALDANIEMLKSNGQIRITVEGHCDERGTNEYNIALGERRARAVRDYLVAGGIDAKRITTISYGEERPFVQGHDESAWKWNRRGHFVMAK